MKRASCYQRQNKADGNHYQNALGNDHGALHTKPSRYFGKGYVEAVEERASKCKTDSPS